MNKLSIVLASLIFLAASCNQPTYFYSDGTVELAGQIINIELADEPHEQSLGLGGRRNIRSDQGMLFLFNRPEIASFWMKDMLFPIDIIWIRDNKVVDLSLYAQPEPGKEDHELRLYQPKTDADMVLEVNAGWAKKNGIKVGDKVDFGQIKR